MVLRKRLLPSGWYPSSAEEITRFLAEIPGSGGAVAAVAPHAGWFYSGKIAALAAASLGPADTVVVAGGHLPQGGPPLFAEEDAVETPLGPMEIDGQFRDALIRDLGGAPDSYRDNTVEVEIPLVRYFFPRAKLLWLRLPSEPGAFETGRRIARIGAALGRNCVFLGSTDLTHYGEAYGFSPQGTGKKALDWVTGVNDRAFINALIAGDPREVLRRAREDSSACSAGAALGALGFAAQRGALPAALLAYGTSADAGAGEVPGSFVGYAALAWAAGPEGLGYLTPCKVFSP
jgi:AmmeMemoRadiSam system protein B